MHSRQEIVAKRMILRELAEVLRVQEFANKNSRALYNARIDLSRLDEGLQESEKRLIAQYENGQ